MLSQEKFENLILDPNKFVEGDIIWDKNKRNPPAFEFRVKIVSDDITALANDPIGVWEQFCLESKITHNGIMHRPQVLALDL
ncbi:MAG: hypothetical protein HCA25_09565 [Dolichospermum sp. DET50]|nr:hypothetical protein [Dolichospermum sp. DET66]MBS3032519.1 hypothetical protein [Dolichospermum sp. DET67]MBS3037725.1 hypothetical protein [Dolichospermum sp. DET50]QSX69670.1 MAG: hypothetical protein EZY12_08790 [Dolichospermum sp. DET69]